MKKIFLIDWLRIFSVMFWGVFLGFIFTLFFLAAVQTTIYWFSQNREFLVEFCTGVK